MIRAVDIKAELAGRPVLSGRDKDTTERPRRRASTSPPTTAAGPETSPRTDAASGAMRSSMSRWKTLQERRQRREKGLERVRGPPRARSPR